jgi:hypothetical protein
MSELKSSSVVRHSDRTASRVLDGSAVVIVIDEQKLHTLNEVGTVVWSTAGTEGRSVESIVDRVVEEFDVERERALEDVLGFVEELVGLGALEIGEDV